MKFKILIVQILLITSQINSQQLTPLQIQTIHFNYLEYNDEPIYLFEIENSLQADTINEYQFKIIAENPKVLTRSQFNESSQYFIGYDIKNWCKIDFSGLKQTNIEIDIIVPKYNKKAAQAVCGIGGTLWSGATLVSASSVIGYSIPNPNPDQNYDYNHGRGKLVAAMNLMMALPLALVGIPMTGGGIHMLKNCNFSVEIYESETE